VHPLWAVAPSAVIIGSAMAHRQLRRIDEERRALVASAQALTPIKAVLGRIRAGAGEASASLDVLERR